MATNLVFSYLLGPRYFLFKKHMNQMQPKGLGVGSGGLGGRGLGGGGVWGGGRGDGGGGRRGSNSAGSGPISVQSAHITGQTEGMTHFTHTTSTLYPHYSHTAPTLHPHYTRTAPPLHPYTDTTPTQHTHTKPTKMTAIKALHSTTPVCWIGVRQNNITALGGGGVRGEAGRGGRRWRGGEGRGGEGGKHV